MPITIFNHFADAVAPYDDVILDVWGCLHDGGAVFPEALDCLNRLAGQGKTVTLLSNAPRRADRVAAALAEKGLAASLYQHIVTSGDAARSALEEHPAPWASELGARVFHMGPERDAGLLDGLPYDSENDIARADFILCTGLDGPEDAVADYESDLRAGAERSLPLVCANPDKTVIRNDRCELCAGALAARYREMGGTVHDFGKPYPAIYHRCLAALDGIERRRVLCVGDGLETDIQGAMNAGFDSLLVTGGLLAPRLSTPPGTPPLAGELEAICVTAGIHPTAALARLAW